MNRLKQSKVKEKIVVAAVKKNGVCFVKRVNDNKIYILLGFFY